MWKKAITLLLTLSAMLTLTACSGNSINSSGTQNNNERGQTFLSENILTLSEYLNSDKPVIAYGVIDILPQSPVTSIRIFQNNTVTYIDTYGEGITLGELSSMTDEEIIALADQYFTIYDMPYLTVLATDVNETYVTSQFIWGYDGVGRFGCNRAEPSEFEAGEVNGAYYYKNGIVVRCEPGKKPFKLDELGTPGIEAGFSLHQNYMQAKMDEIYQFPEDIRR